ncbi:hypothetical protein BUALT_Bualt03G0198400 [Buddleja alternifolia]|uniref:Uncharacterized protein n=1 Tax=Buddleja alternifolia TaxID=168488 RepID=A0AAV6Y2H4_9LAMI|nr:hypothetical protein BUALT_Bualt03G0198400 [Buddleja alternifolia]
MHMATILEHCKIPPAGDSKTPEISLPLTFFDMLWHGCSASQSVLFFNFPYCSKSHFMDAIVPDLKTSLSLTLTHFLPFSGNIIIHPLTSPARNNPILRYQAGDSVSFTVSESCADFNNFIGNHPRVSDKFYAFAPQLPPATHSEYSIACPVLALQVTLFPEQGLCIGFTTHHAVADASTVASFIQIWASINRSRMSISPDHINIWSPSTENKTLPYYGRDSVTNLNGLDSLYWGTISLNHEFSSPFEPPPVKFPINKLRATFVLKKAEIQRLKNIVLTMCPSVCHLSSFTVICALVWVCTAKSDRDEVADEELEYFRFAADCRGRLNPPLPLNYFGNCVKIVKAELKHGVVKGTDGFLMAVKVIAEATKENVYHEKGILYGAENWLKDGWEMTGKRQCGVWGSPRFDFYAVDYGWGKPNKFEVLSIDGGGAISLCKSREFEGGLEIGLSYAKVQMDTFTNLFTEVLTNLLQQKS